MSFAATAADGKAADADLERYRLWVEQMSQAERGPFDKVLWFCRDGSIRDPIAYGCREYGGGHMHGRWSPRTIELREQGFRIANLLAGIDAAAFLADPEFRDALGQILVEKYLYAIADGWIMRRALYYRGAVQDEDERAGARALLQRMAADPEWLTTGFTLLRTAAKSLPHGSDHASIQGVRQSSAALADQDRAFEPIRTKIHGAPDATDAEAVRGYASTMAPQELQAAYAQLATDIDQLYQPLPFEEVLRERGEAYNLAPWLQEVLFSAADDLGADASVRQRFERTAELLATLRESLPRINAPYVRVQVLDLGMRAELEHFRAATELRPQLTAMTRQELGGLLHAAARAAFGTGLINTRLMGELDALRETQPEGPESLETYIDRLAYQGRVPAWGMQALRMHFQASMNKLALLEPKAQFFIQDQVRGSPLLFYADVLDLLMRDANRLLGVRHHVFGDEVGFGLTALNPGLARGVLHASSSTGAEREFTSTGIYLLPETVAELPPVAGILTAGEGNPLSHIQLLARNLGIPNVVVADNLIGKLAEHDLQPAVLAVSPKGLVELSADGPEWDPYFPARAVQQTLIHPDMKKIDFTIDNFIPLSELRADDSGRSVGPKAAKLGELHSIYPQAVARGLAIPFGIFRKAVMFQPWRGDVSGKTTVFDWMQAQYHRLDAIPAGSEERNAETEKFRAELYETVVNTPIHPDMQTALREALDGVFGPGPWPGMFIRSDTNVEDLPGFTGAGLNLTLPNVVGFDLLLQGIRKVWASPFTERAFAWRQALMTEPEHVYTSILLLESVAVDKSGVLVTQDIDSGDTNVVSVALNEGPGGAVDGQAAESLRIPLDGSKLKVLASATAPTRRVMNPEGGVVSVPASGSDTLLQPAEVEQLIQFARELPAKFPAIVDASGEPAPADVEFGFEDGQLRLFQIRPFLDNPLARGSEYLRKMDATLTGQGGQSGKSSSSRMVDPGEVIQP